MLLTLALSGCGANGPRILDHSTAATNGTSSATAKDPSAATPAASPEGSAVGAKTSSKNGVDQHSADQIEGAVNDAQSLLDGLDQDFATDDQDG